MTETDTPAPRVVPAAGERAPDIELPDADGNVHRLIDRAGRWTVIFFYPADDTPGCTIESCQFRDLADAFDEAGTEVWGISPDDAISHARFRAKYGLRSVLLSDEDHAVATRYGAWAEKTLYGRRSMGIIRSSFLVDPDLRIRRAWPQVKADGHAAAVLAVLDTERVAK